jgi:hypothetical protein
VDIKKVYKILNLDVEERIILTLILNKHGVGKLARFAIGCSGGL